MIRVGLIAVIAVLTAASAIAQMQRVDPAVPRPLPESKVEPAGELAATVPPRLIQNERRSRSDVDVRHCLALPTNSQIHRCAHPYLSRASRTRVAKSAGRAKPAAAAKAAETAKPTNLPKPPGATVSPSDAAKAADLVKPMDVTKRGGTPKPVESAKAGATAKPDAAKSAPPARPEPGKK